MGYERIGEDFKEKSERGRFSQLLKGKASKEREVFGPPGQARLCLLAERGA